ncbi:MAG: tetratricopeptide repeat protein [Thermodesulfobacteriota bacterium]
MTRRLLIIATFFLFVLSLPSSALSSVPSTEDPVLLLLINDYNEENYEEAIEALEKFRIERPSDALAAYYLGLAYKKTFDFENAIKNFKDALALDVTLTEALAELAEVSFQAGKDKEALKYIEQMEADGVEPAIAAFLHGMVSLRQQRYDSAIEYFERAESLDRSLSQSTKYQIGVAYLRKGDLQDAADILKEVIDLDPETNLAINALDYLRKKRERKKQDSKFGVYANIGFEYDSNVVLMPRDQPVAVGTAGGNDRVFIANLYADYAAISRGPVTVKGRYGLYLNRHDKNTQYDYTSHQFSILPTFKIGNNFLNIPMTQSFTLLDQKEYLNKFSIEPAYFHKLLKSYIAASFRYSIKDFHEEIASSDDDRDARFYAVSLRWIKFLMDNQAMVDVKYEISREKTDGNNWSYNGHGVYASSTLPLAEKLKLSLAGELQAHRFDNTDTVFLKKRDDNYYALSAIISYGLIDEVSFQFSLKYILNKSNISAYDYNRSKVGMGLEYRY